MPRNPPKWPFLNWT
ncbi:hypothetical protein F383_02842 [Gossypium arboreum]|uniref:Uncharacterized protein n=1 Tax=Gossypium arboreum TaxID=29729 RepID=A0A0B0NG41_GOSAR|nr:hypothetical protein F383_02842 [Gossypium arboreum]